MGEAHGVKYNDYSKKEEVFEWITDVYTKAFKRVPLVINYHRLVGILLVGQNHTLIANGYSKGL
ncbi:hypothetical protein KUBF_01890 [Bacteroides finegoldii]|nr:hypothetical protein KUBF_01890 [Bacteroides finegoldii]